MRLTKAIIAVVLISWAFGSGSLANHAAGAAGAYGEQPVNRQAGVYSAAPLTIAGTAWTRIEPKGPVGGLVRSEGIATVTVSLNARGAPFDVRARWGNGAGTVPDKTHFVPSDSSSGFSFTFVFPQDKKRGCHGFEIDVRSTTGNKTTIKSEDAVLTYARPPHAPRRACRHF